MRIIKRGSLPEHREIETTCNRCKTVFAFMVSEAKLTGDQRDGDFYTVDCPVCDAAVMCRNDKPGARAE